MVNNSWGFPDLVGQCYTEFESDIQALQAAGIPVVFSAGNQGIVGNVSPANNPSSFAVGSVDELENVADHSSRGPSACDVTVFPEIVAPGVSVKAADLTFGGFDPLSYADVSGTSFAAPHVSATMALLRRAFPEATVEQLEQALMDSAYDPYQDGPDDTYGYGILDAVEAYNRIANISWPSCTDYDSDGFFSESGCGSELDCNDFVAAINPAACDIKSDGIDQDCNGVDRTRGKGCPVSNGGDPGGDDPVSSPEGRGDTCSDGIDNDLDGDVDCQDSGCSKNKSCKNR